jgi:hypothetical protein
LTRAGHQLIQIRQTAIVPLIQSACEPINQQYLCTTFKE